MNTLQPDTICAASTPAGVGGLAVIRVSGPGSIAACAPLLRGAHYRIEEQAAGTVRHATLLDDKGRELDDVVVTVFKAPRSFTGEDCVEISCHGSRYIQRRLVESLISTGCRLARAGEFTQRAFLNGKMDLSQAEAVANLISANSQKAGTLALKQLRGGISNELVALREQLCRLASLLELELDFNEEDVTFASREDLRNLCAQTEDHLARLCQSFRVGNAIKNGVPVAIVGETNAGKSTLLNALLGEEKAIVSDVHGTTRDSIEDCVNIEGITFRFIDTAGLRQTDDRIEQMGIERTLCMVEKASIVLWLISPDTTSQQMASLYERLQSRLNDQPILVIFNKSDLSDVQRKTELETDLTTLAPDLRFLHLSAKHGEGLPQLQRELVSLVGIDTLDENDTVVTDLRHYEALQAALSALVRVKEGLQTDLSGDFIAQDLREALHHLGLITGTITTDELLGQIFAKFCIGK